MILHHGTHPVGSWRFAIAAPRLDGAAPNAALARAIAALPPVAAILRTAELLIIDRASARVAGRHLRVDLAAGTADPIAAALHAVTSRWWATPLCHVRFEGRALTDPTAPWRTAALVDLGADDVGGHSSVSVDARCDAWLPVDLRGRPPSAQHARRLRAALEAIARALETPGHPRPSTLTRLEGDVVTNGVGDEPSETGDRGDAP